MQVNRFCPCGFRVCKIIDILKIKFFNFSGDEKIKKTFLKLSL